MASEVSRLQAPVAQSLKINGANSLKSAEKLDYIDAVRGWAILLVITSHVGGRFSQMPYPIKKLTNFGWHGVQLFFLASAVTLMMSWSRQKSQPLLITRHFFIRRFLRISPMYYAGALIYYFAEPPAAGFDLSQLLRSLFFVNAWHPTWLPTTPGWIVVPGGWSVGVEFTFYLIFPLLAMFLTTIRRAILFTTATIVFAIVINRYAATEWFVNYDRVYLENFLYYWFPNQAPVFGLGIILYHVLRMSRYKICNPVIIYAILAITGLVCILAAERPTSSTSFSYSTVAPTIFIATICFMCFIFVMDKGSPTIFVHKWIRMLGVLSFSCYILHFLFVSYIPFWFDVLIDVKATGLRAVLTAALLWMVTMACTVAAAAITHRLVEQPGISLARRFTSSRKSSIANLAANTIDVVA